MAYKFNRYVDGKLMAEGIVIERESSFESALAVALRVCPLRNNTVLVYDEPAARKPMTEEEIKMALLIRGFPYDAFRAGIRFAERHHGIGGGE